MERGELKEVRGHHDTQGGVLDVWAPGASAHGCMGYGHVGYGCMGISPKGDVWLCFS